MIAVASKSENNCSQADIFRTKFSNQTLSDQLLVLLNESCVGKNQVAQLCICLLFKPSQWERIDCDFSFFSPLRNEAMKQMDICNAEQQTAESNDVKYRGVIF